MELYTGQMSSWRKAKELGATFIDITVKAGDKTFAPEWDFLMKYKRDGDEEAYTERFIPLMRRSYVNNKDRWLEVCSLDKVVIACYCASGKFCHRNIVREMLEKVCYTNGIPFQYKGELK